MQYSNTLASIVDQSAGKMVSVTFVKKDGSTRVLNGRLGVTKYLKNSKKVKQSAGIITIYDVKNCGYRSIMRDSILAVRSAGIEAVAVR